MITSLCWVPRGYAKKTPQFEDYDEEAIKKEQALLEEQYKQSMEGEEEIMDQNDVHPQSEELSSDAVAAKKNKKGNKKNNNRTQEDMDLEQEVIKEYGLDNYDTESDNEEEENGKGFHFSSVDTAFELNDPAFTAPYKDDMDARFDTESLDDLILKDSDILLLFAKVDEDDDGLSRLELCVYEDAEDNLYVHHDILLGAYPLCLEWSNYLNGDANVARNLAIVGSITGVVEIWDLDIIDPTHPAARLGKACNTKKSRRSNVEDPNSHSDAVMSLAWNSAHRNILASGSADKKIKLWDVSKETCQITLNYHKDKVQSLKWGLHNPTHLLSGGFDSCVYLANPVSLDSKQLFKVNGDVECLNWNPHIPEQFMVSCDNGEVACFDIRNNKKALYTLHAHNKACTQFTFNKDVNGMLITTGMDKHLKVWDLADNKPVNVFSREMNSPIFALGACPDMANLIAIGGNEGEMRIFDLYGDSGLLKRFKGRSEKLNKRADELDAEEGNVTATMETSNNANNTTTENNSEKKKKKKNKKKSKN